MILAISEILERYLDPPFLARCLEGQAAVPAVAAYTLDGRRVRYSGGEQSVNFPERLDAAYADNLADVVTGENDFAQIGQAGVSILLAPVRIEEGVVGFLAVEERDAGGAATLALLRMASLACGEHVAGRRNTHDLTVDLTERYEELSLVYMVSEGLSLKLRQHEAVQHVLKGISEQLGSDLVLLYVPALALLETYPTVAPEAGRLATRMLKESQQGGNLVAYHLEEHADRGLARDCEGFAHVAASALRIDGDEGALVMARRAIDDRLFMSQVKLLGSVGRQLEIQLTNFRITENRKQLYNLTIFSMAKLAESRDPETGEHLERVGLYCRILAQQLLDRGLYADLVNEQFVETIALSSSLHDIGKVGVPDNVLQKPGKLTADEFEVMKKHAIIGGETLRAIEARLGWGESTFLSMGREIAFAHHEKWNGGGYPFGVRGENIPLSARIMAIADVYDALTSKRCYKEAFSHERARDIICADSGTHFDPSLVEIFIEQEEAFRAVRQRIADSPKDFVSLTQEAMP